MTHRDPTEPPAEDETPGSPDAPRPPHPNDAGEPSETVASGEVRRFGNYRLLRELGRGAQGVVWLAEDVGLRRKVALKMLTGAGAESQLTRDRFKREAELTSKFEHPGICGVHDFGEAEGLPYIAMQYVRGTTLASIVEKARDVAGGAKGGDAISIAGGGNKGALEDVLRLVERAARALHVAHEAGLVHRDIKPANIMVTTEGHPVLLDFGLARDTEAEGQTLTQSGQILGTPAYLAPEQIVASRGTVDRRTDVYALGVTLFECLTLRRPFEGQSWDQLFHAILDGAPPSPRAINPRIPRELATVIEVAMERDQARRYPTAEALAEDLRRVRSFEPIQAQAASTWTRARKWARRNPGRATGAVAIGVFAFTGLALVGGRFLQRRGELRDQLHAASEALATGNFVDAAVAVAKARELDPESAEVLELKTRVERAQEEAQRELERGKALAAAAEARKEEKEQRERYEAVRRELDELSAELVRDRPSVQEQAADEARRAAFAMREKRQRALRLEAEQLRLSRSEALQRAARLEEPWGGATAATQSALADYYLERWREALEQRDPVSVEAMRSAAEEHDPRAEHREELLGRGSLTLELEPAGAEVFLFRWESYESVRESDVIPRLVPVPSSGVGRVRPRAWAGDFHPGDPCLVVTEVEPGSPAERAGFARGDLVLAVGGAACDGSVHVREVKTGSPAATAGLAPLARITKLDDAAIDDPFDWSTRVAAARGAPCRLTWRGAGDSEPRSAACDPRDVRIATGLDLVRSGAPVPVRLLGLHAGERIELDLSADARSGLVCERTAYPLILAPGCKLASGAPITVDPGSYLLFARAPGFEDQRVNLLLERRAMSRAKIELQPEGTTPASFVYVPPGPFLEGGDPEAFKPRAARTVELPAYCIARKELTNREWYEFVNDPETLARIDAAPPGKHAYLPQDDRVMARRAPDGTGWTWDVYEHTTAESPVLGINWTDARDYVQWRNRKAQQAGELWRYDLPSESEWEKAARGADGRAFPWGDRFDPALAVCRVRKLEYLLDVPGGFEPRDESPFGVRDLAGSREEWLRDAVGEGNPPFYGKRGGHWSSFVEGLFRAASRGSSSEDYLTSGQGLRLVLRRVE